MSQHAQGLHTLSPGEIPPKRKRGRPRKDSAQAERTPEGPAPESSKKCKQSGGSSHQATNGMVGQVVSGVIDGTFHAGYLLNVKVGESDTKLRGLVFLPGRVAPLTPANDVAPYARMYKRRAVPFPTPKQQSQPSGSAHPEQSDKQPVEPDEDVPRVARVFYSQFSSPQSGISEAPKHPSLAVVVPPANNAPKTGTGLSLSGKVMPSQLEEPKVDEWSEVLQEIETPKLMKEHNDVEANEDSKTEPEAEPAVDAGLATEASKLTKGPNEVEVTEMSKAESESELVVDAVLSAEASKVIKGPNVVEANEDSKTEPESEPVVGTILGAEASKVMKGPGEVEATEESKVEPESEPAADVFPGIETSTQVKGPTDVEANKESKEEPVPQLAVDISQGNEAFVKQPEIHDQVMTLNLELNQAAMDIEPELENSELVNNLMEKQGNRVGVLEEPQSGLAVEVPNKAAKPVDDATNITGVVSLSAVKHSQEEVIPPKTELACEGHLPARPAESEIRSPSGDLISMECDEQDAIPPPQI